MDLSVLSHSGNKSGGGGAAEATCSAIIGFIWVYVVLALYLSGPTFLAQPFWPYQDGARTVQNLGPERQTLLALPMNSKISTGTLYHAECKDIFNKFGYFPANTNRPIPEVWFWVGCRKVIMDGVRMARKLPSLGRFSRMVLEIEILS